MRSGFDPFDPEWLAAEAIRIGLIVLAGFLLAVLVGGFFGLLGNLLGGLSSTVGQWFFGVGAFLSTVLRYTTLVTAVLYAVDRGT
ncbi:hypothetical protein [Halomarina litorea]|uniref:hypothetical protein n=1 Tax=Halomarina litorea TaxID=2961595 RepID=UPI0020C4AE18|nr:hypothetical protein [Halomarina sp. BCD28]